ncbi:MAG: FG-GAP-like repeat-containing protein [Bacteroidota bacterium]
MKLKNLPLLLFTLATFNFQFLTHKTQAQVCFTSATNFTTGTHPTSVISADFNGDGKADLAVASESNNVSVLLGDGLGNFGTFTNFAVGNAPYSIISADFNGDSKVDLATTNLGSNNISILLGDGLGNFSPATNFAVGTSPYSLISADFNGDNKADLAIANSGSNNVSVLLGDGLGSFGAATNFVVDNYPESIVSVDFNGDTKADLAVVNQTSNNVSILLGNGSGSFGPATNFSVGSTPTSIISSDFNGDSKADLAVSNYLNVSVLLGDGTGGFGSVSNFALANSPNSVNSADYNGDGKSDLAMVSAGGSGNISVLLGNGTGGFGSAANFTAGSDACSIISGNFNGDNKPDFVVANYMPTKVSILLNNSFIVTAQATATTVCVGATVTLTGGGATSYTWTGGAIDTVAFTCPSSTTTYTVTGTTAGCSDTVTITITVNPAPTATFTIHDESSTLYCDGSIVADLTGGTGTILPEWLDNTQTVIANIDSIGALCSGSYTLNIIDANLCTNTYTQAILAGPIPPTPPICLITVDITNTHNIVVWEKTNLDLTAIDSFVVYREISTNIYQPIGAVPKDSISTFDDFAANPATTGYRYKLKSKNTHGVTSLFCEYHNTIYLTNTGANFSWTPYQIENNTTPVSNYYIYRDDNSTGNFILIGNTTGNQFGYTDIQFASFPDASYYVEAVMVAGGCQPTRTDFTASRSNVKHFGTAGVQELNTHTVVNIYPNPAGNTLNITGITGKTTLLLYDVVGKLVLEKEVENNTILNTSHLVDGIYTLLTESKMGRSFNKVVISR